ncbi:Uncharacterised protein [Burkholderia pseudomallei]|nr:Uncharacterised protein [Burkholderia pseudomallei]CAJ4173068.1 Uncharacterised protein [Burkholderia pseudomallei]CAJ4615230.1 Uncharacterised protein [Burkholderia pseudomallei]CAJ5597688.1 Uncharacterised protein [Burkholderia pseudomallei]CAJ6081841.1 Uncharacterised protein [Burkholderia pseudomallei]
MKTAIFLVVFVTLTYLTPRAMQFVRDRRRGQQA